MKTWMNVIVQIKLFVYLSKLIPYNKFGSTTFVSVRSSTEKSLVTRRDTILAYGRFSAKIVVIYEVKLLLF